MPPHLMQGDIDLTDYEVRKFRINRQSVYQINDIQVYIKEHYRKIT